MLAQTRLLVPNTLPSSREADNSTARVVIPLAKTAVYNIHCCARGEGEDSGKDVDDVRGDTLEFIADIVVLQL